MKTKTLISLAVASTLGWSAGAIAGSSHEVMTPSAANESGEVILKHGQGFSGPQPELALGATSSSASSSDSFSSSSASVSSDESLALGDQGIYSEYYVVSYTPMVETYYIIDSEQLSWNDDAFSLSPTHELALIPSSSDEMFYDLVLVPVDEVTASYSFDSEMSTGD